MGVNIRGANLRLKNNDSVFEDIIETYANDTAGFRFSRLHYDIWRTTESATTCFSVLEQGYNTWS